MTTADSEVLLLRAEGPFSFMRDGCAPCLFNVAAHLRCGIYLFTVACEGRELIHYVGQTTRSFCQRLGEEFKGYQCGEFEIYDGVEFAHGRLRTVWERQYLSPQRVAEFDARSDELLPHLDKQLRATRLWLIPISGDPRTIKLMESAMSKVLHQQPPPAGPFLYTPRFTHRRAAEQPIAFALEDHGRFLGLPAQLTT